LRSRLGERISAFELVSRNCLEAVLSHSPGVRDPLPKSHPWYVLVQLADSSTDEALFEAAAGALEAREAVIAQSGEQSRRLWQIRETLPEAQFANVKHDISIAVSQIPHFIERAGAALQAQFPGAPIFCFGHVGDGNLHYNVGSPELMAKRAEVNRIVYRIVAEFGGSISAEHGLGQLKREDVLLQKSDLEMELMRILKRALDPNGVMNPGKVI
jgi:FAD/FMN-containing dehydrogenase